MTKVLLKSVQVGEKQYHVGSTFDDANSATDIASIAGAGGQLADMTPALERALVAAARLIRSGSEGQASQVLIAAAARG